MNRFNDNWVKFDQKGKGFIEVLKFPKFLEMIIADEIEHIFETR